MKWFIKYGLKYREGPGKAAVKGTICHYVMEALAKSLMLRQNGRVWCNDDVIGRISINEDIDSWIEKSWNHFTQEKEASQLDWTDKDREDIENAVGYVLRCKLSPRNAHKIIAPEQEFRIKIPYDWARYSYFEDGAIVKDQLSVIGFVDLVYRDKDNILNYIDYKFGGFGKSGSPKDWVTGKVHTEETLHKNIQLCLYYWAMKHTYPDEEVIKTHIWYPNYKKLYSMTFSDENIQEAMSQVRDTFGQVKDMRVPECNHTWKCKWCVFSQTNLQDWNNTVQLCHSPDRDKFDDVNGQASVCDALRYFFKHRKLDLIVEKLKYGVI